MKVSIDLKQLDNVYSIYLEGSLAKTSCPNALGNYQAQFVFVSKL